MQPTGDEIREERESLGLSRAQLAARITGVSERTIVRAESNEPVSSRTLAAIARYLKIGEFRNAGPTLREASDVELAEEQLRRARQREADGEPAGLPRLPPDLASPDELGYDTQAARQRRALRNLSVSVDPDITDSDDTP